MSNLLLHSKEIYVPYNIQLSFITSYFTENPHKPYNVLNMKM